MGKNLLAHTRNLIANRIGLLVHENEQHSASLQKVVTERVSSLNLSGIEEYCQFLEADNSDLRQEREILASLLTTGETYFFRDSGQQALLQNRILPELLEHRKAERTLRIWSAACSSGEEAYSMAIMLDELMTDQSQWNILILGTDISHSAIKRARQGIYTEWSFRSMSNERRQRYFHQYKNTWELDEAIRRRVTFKPGDLIADEFPTGSDLHDMDLILCRNAFIYMSAMAVSHVADKFTERLVEGGMLLVGHGELYAHHLGKLRTRVFPESIVYQKVSTPFIMPAPGLLAEASQSIPEEKQSAVLPIIRPPPIPAVPPAHLAVAEIRKTTADSKMQQAWEDANQGRRDSAEKSCREMAAENPLVAEPQYLLAMLAQERGDFEAAKNHLKHVIYLDSLFIAAYLDLGDLYEREGDSGRSRTMRATACKLLKTLPGDAQVRFYGASSASAVLEYAEHLLVNGN